MEQFDFEDAQEALQDLSNFLFLLHGDLQTTDYGAFVKRRLEGCRALLNLYEDAQHSELFGLIPSDKQDEYYKNLASFTEIFIQTTRKELVLLINPELKMYFGM